MDRAIHLLYVPTLCCNLGCSCCYLVKQPTEAALNLAAQRPAGTLRHTRNALRHARVLAFTLSLHAGAGTTDPAPVRDSR